MYEMYRKEVMVAWRAHTQAEVLMLPEPLFFPQEKFEVS
jgi:hypothetical protein